MISFRNDYSEGAHPQVLAALEKNNLITTCGYSMDDFCAEARGIVEGDYVEAYNDRGHCVCKAKFDMGVRPGMVSSPKGWHRGAYVAGSYQELTSDHLNLLHMNTSFDDTLVEVRKYEGEVK